jgi:hypothetical protein
MEITKEVKRKRKREQMVRGRQERILGKKDFNLLLVRKILNIFPRVFGLMEPSNLLPRGLGK